MSKKRGLTFAFLALLIMILLSTYALAQANETEAEKVDNAYNFLADEVKAKGFGDVESAAFAILALKNFDSSLADDGIRELMQKSVNNECWPSPQCKVKETALAMIALHEMGEDTSKVKAWLLARQILSFEEGDWFLQLEIKPEGSNGTCEIAYEFQSENKNDKVFVATDKKVSLEKASNCFEIENSRPWWLKVKSICQEIEFSASCEQPEYIGNLLFITGNTIFVFPEIRNEPGILALKNKCFPAQSGGGSCDYDATLWASYALKLEDEELQTLPFLETNADANKPHSFSLLFLITGDADFADKLAAEQKSAGFWDTDRFFRTAIAYLSVRGLTVADLNKAKSWLLDNQNPDSSWGATQKVRDTAAVLFAVFPKGAAATTQFCDDFSGFVCCDTASVKIGADEFDRRCLGSGEVCVAEDDCEVQLECTDPEVGGVCCEQAASGAERFNQYDDTCSSGEVCASECEVAAGTEEQLCEDQGYFCCDADKVARGASLATEFTCTSSGQVCATACKQGGGISSVLLWILLIVVVVAVVVALILFLRKRKGGRGKGELTPLTFGPPTAPRMPPIFRRPAGPAGPPIRIAPRPMSRPAIPAPRAPVRPAARIAKGKKGKTEEELEKTLKELKEI